MKGNDEIKLTTIRTLKPPLTFQEQLACVLVSSHTLHQSESIANPVGLSGGKNRRHDGAVDTDNFL